MITVAVVVSVFYLLGWMITFVYFGMYVSDRNMLGLLIIGGLLFWTWIPCSIGEAMSERIRKKTNQLYATED